MSNSEPMQSDPNDMNPLYAGSSAWADPAIRELYAPQHIDPNDPRFGHSLLNVPAKPVSGEERQIIPAWAFYLL